MRQWVQLNQLEQGLELQTVRSLSSLKIWLNCNTLPNLFYSFNVSLMIKIFVPEYSWTPMINVTLGNIVCWLSTSTVNINTSVIIGSHKIECSRYILQTGTTTYIILSALNLQGQAKFDWLGCPLNGGKTVLQDLRKVYLSPKHKYPFKRSEANEDYVTGTKICFPWVEEFLK